MTLFESKNRYNDLYNEHGISTFEYNHLRHLKYIHENGFPWDHSATYKAAENCHLECLKYLHNNGCPWDDYTAYKAAESGDMECLKYVYTNGCPWNSRIGIQIRVKVWWMMVQDFVRARSILLFWKNQTAIQVCPEKMRISRKSPCLSKTGNTTSKRRCIKDKG